MSVSVVICTYNRAAVLETTLASACRLAAPRSSWQLLVVDNNSRDDTRAVTDKFRDRLPLRYIFEPRQGKTIALNRAVGESSGQLLVFTDDDVQLDANWLIAFVEGAERHPDAGWFGGRITPWFPAGRPSWIRQESLPALRGYLGLYDLGDQERYYAKGDEAPCGACMAVRRTTFERVGTYREDLGPSGDRKGTHDDSELIWRAEAAGIRGVYLPQAACEHLVPADRLALRWFYRHGLGKGANSARTETNAIANGEAKRAVWYAIRALRQAAKGRWDRVCLCAMNIGIEIGRRREFQKRIRCRQPSSSPA